MDYHRMSLWAAVVMAYARPFVSGYRIDLAKGLVPKGRRAAIDHAFMIATRHRYVAHLDKNNLGMEEVRVFAVLTEPSAKPAVRIAVRGLRWGIPTERNLDRIDALVKMQEKRFRGRANAVQGQLREALRRRDPSSVYLAAARNTHIRVDEPVSSD